MLPPTMARGLLGKFPRSEDLPTVDQCAIPLPVRSPTSLPLQAILTARNGGRGARGGAGGHKIPRDGGGGSRGTGGRSRDERGANQGTEGAAREKKDATETTVSTESGRRGETEDPSGVKQNDCTERKYHMGGTDTEESASNSADWSGEET